jgi:undecaprenyl-diphosphatase
MHDRKPVFAFIAVLAIAVAPVFAADQAPAFTAGGAAAVPSPASGGMTVPQAVVLGAVEGITEYLPVSSTGHLLVAQSLLGLWKTPAEKTASDAYAICIQLGAILAVFLIFFGRIKQMVLGIFGRDNAGLKLAGNLIVALIPAAVFGVLLESRIKQYLYGVWPIAAAWFVGGLFILFVLRKKGSQGGIPLEGLSWQKALIIGLVQCFALWPGMSRSLSTMAPALLLGLSVPAAVEFSFLLGLLTLGGATVFEGVDKGGLIISTFGWLSPVVGLVVAGITAFVAVKWMISYLTRRSLSIFGWYRLAAAAAAAVLVLAGAL